MIIPDEKDISLTYYQEKGARKKKKQKAPPVTWEVTDEDGFGIRITSDASIGVLSFRINGQETAWCWDQDVIRPWNVPDTESPAEWNMLLLAEGKKLITAHGLTG